MDGVKVRPATTRPGERWGGPAAGATPPFAGDTAGLVCL